MERSASSGSGVDRLLAQIKPRWTRERHERVFAAIIERIRTEAGDESDDEHERRDERPAAGVGAGLGHFEGGHTHA